MKQTAKSPAARLRDTSDDMSTVAERPTYATSPDLAAPIHMDVELSSKCNLRCRFCHLSYFDPKEITQFSLSEFKEKIGPVLPHLSSITLFNKYEALTCRDFIPIFDFVSGFDIETYFSTNGLLLDDQIVEAIVGRLTYLTISITGFTRESYTRNMKHDGFAQLQANLDRLNRRKRELGTGKPILRISTVGMLDALDELEMAVDFAARHDAEEGVQVTAFKAHHDDLVALMPLKDPAAYTRASDRALAHARDQGVKLVLQSGSIAENGAQTESLGHRHCDMPWHRLSVQPSGDVYPCPMAYEPIGDLADQSITDIWRGKALAGFRAGVNDPDNMNRDCVACTHCRHRSLTRPEVNDFSNATTYPTGMTRKPAAKSKVTST